MILTAPMKRSSRQAADRDADAAGSGLRPAQELTDSNEELRACREALRSYFAGLKQTLLEKRISGLEEEWLRQGGTRPGADRTEKRRARRRAQS